MSAQNDRIDQAVLASEEAQYLRTRTDFGHAVLQAQLTDLEERWALTPSISSMEADQGIAETWTELDAVIPDPGSDSRLQIRRDGSALRAMFEETAAGAESKTAAARDDAFAARIDRSFRCDPWRSANSEFEEDLTAACDFARALADVSTVITTYLDARLTGRGTVDGIGAGTVRERAAEPFDQLLDRRFDDVKPYLPDFLVEEDDVNITEADWDVLDAVRRTMLDESSAPSGTEPSVKNVLDGYSSLLTTYNQLNRRSLTQLALRHDDQALDARREKNLVRAAALGTMAVLFIGAAAFVARRRRRLGRLENELFTDSLTGLRNRHWLERVAAPTFGQRSRGGHVVIHVDIDRFKAINDTFGHAIGDRVLIRTAELCGRAINRPDSVARLGGDEFVIIVHDLTEPVSEARRIAGLLRRSLREPIELDGRRITVDVSIGITTKQGPSTLDSLLLEADSALYEAKNTGRGRTIEYGDTNRPYIVRHLASAFARGEIRCELQPQIDLTHGNVGAVEVLARWYTTDGTVIPIPELIRTIESLGYTGRLFEIVVKSASEAAELLADQFAGRFWINISPLDLTSFDADERLLEVMAGSGLPFNRIGVEVTETVQMVDLDHAANMLAKLRDHDIAVAIDDFGSGNTPLKHLTDLPLDMVKLDRSVISSIDREPQARVIVEAMGQVAEALAVDLLAEGVERPAELEALQKLGVTHGQGYLFARPMTPSALLAYLEDPERHRARRSLIDLTDDTIG